MLCGMDWTALRAVFRQEREKRVGSRAKLVERANEHTDDGLDESTVYRIETDADYWPGIDTFTRLIEAMPGLTLTTFFAAVEGITPPVNLGASETEADAREFAQLPKALRTAALAVAIAIRTSQQSAPDDESLPARPQEERTK